MNLLFTTKFAIFLDGRGRKVGKWERTKVTLSHGDPTGGKKDQ